MRTAKFALGVAFAAGIVQGNGIGRADPISDPWAWEATCIVLGEDLTADPDHDFKIMLGISKSLASEYGLSESTAFAMESYHVHDHCPQYEPYVLAAVAVEYAQTH